MGAHAHAHHKKGDRVTAWNYTFTWTDDHLSLEELWPLKFTYDTLSEKALRKLNQISSPREGALSRTKSEDAQKEKGIPAGAAEAKTTSGRRDLYKLLEEHHSEHEDLENLWQQIWTVPEWVDWDQIARGQDVFYRYGAACLTGLTYQSLLGGMGAQKVVETLARTGGFSPKVARHRLLETTQHILQSTKSLEAIQPGGEGFQSTVRVRLLHSAVRQRIMKMVETRPDYYNVEEWGIPINDIDSVGTIGSFSAALLWVSLPRLGVYLRKQEIADYIALWRYIGYVIGTPDDFFVTPAKAKAIMECLMIYEIDPSEVSKIMANNVVVCLAGKPPAYTSANMLVASARWLNGDKLCDALALPNPGFYYKALMAGQCIVFMFFAYAYRYIPSFDRAQIAFLRRSIWKVVVENKSGLGGTESLFAFKYVPQYATITDMGKFEGGKHSYIEWRNLRALIIAGGVCGLAVASSVKVLMAAMGR